MCPFFCSIKKKWNFLWFYIWIIKGWSRYFLSVYHRELFINILWNISTFSYKYLIFVTTSRCDIVFARTWFLINWSSRHNWFPKSIEIIVRINLALISIEVFIIFCYIFFLNKLCWDIIFPGTWCSLISLVFNWSMWIINVYRNNFLRYW